MKTKNKRSNESHFKGTNQQFLSRIFTLVVLLVTMNLDLWVYAGPDNYWVSYEGFITKYGPHPPGGPKYLIKIDVLGNIVVAPRKVIDNSPTYSSPQGASTAISNKSSSQLNMWVPGRLRIIKGLYQSCLFRAVIDKQTLNVVSFRRTSAVTLDYTQAQVTQKVRDNFLVIAIGEARPEDDRYEGLRLSPIGALSGQQWRLTSNGTQVRDGYAESAISSDGMVFLFTETISSETGLDVIRLRFQRLGVKGYPIGEVGVVPLRREISLLDVSNRIADNRRYILYGVRGRFPGDNDLYLQVVNSKTAEKLGSPIRVGNHSNSSPRGAIIDPSGRFVIYATSVIGSLVYQALDATGHPSGFPQTVVTSDVEGGLDVLKD